MKTNVSLDLTDDQRRQLANLIDGKVTQRLATRKEIVTFTRQHIAGLVAESEPTDEDVNESQRAPSSTASVLYQIDPEDRPALTGRSPGYIRGWNLVKRSRT